MTVLWGLMIRGKRKIKVEGMWVHAGLAKKEGAMREKKSSKKAVDRRTFLKIAAAAAGPLVMQRFPSGHLFAAEARPELEDRSYEKFYNNFEGRYMKDPKWVEQTLPRLQWPKGGERVPELKAGIQKERTYLLESMRKVATDAQELGLKYNLEIISISKWSENNAYHYQGDVQVHPGVARPERVDPDDWLTSRAYGLDQRNYGEWVNKEYDRLVRLQTAESDPKKRLEYVHQAQKLLAEDYFITQFGWGPAIIEAYNAAGWDGAVQIRGFGLATADMPWSYLDVQPKTSRKRLHIGMPTIMKTSNIMAAGSRERGILRMIYDRLAYLDKDLKVIPWALESWKKVDNRTWDAKLRGGMKFHDGKPVTVDDLKFSLDFVCKYDRAEFWTSDQYLEKTEILDRANRMVRFTFKEPYGQFETAFLLVNVILPKHLFEGIMEKQNVGDNARHLQIPEPVGSGPFKWGQYKKDAELLLVANKEHFHAPKIDELLMVCIPSVDGLMGRLETQEIDFVDNGDFSLIPSQAEQLKKHNHLRIVRTTDIGWYHLVPRISWLPWRDIEFRRAWHHSIDRKFLVDVVWEGGGRIPKSNTFLVEGNPFHNPNLPSIPQYDLKAARQILKDAGYSWDKEGRLVYPPPTDKKFIERVTRVCKPGFSWGGLKMQASR